MTSGGHNRINFRHSEETKILIGEKGEGRIPWNKGTKGIMKVNSGSFKKGEYQGFGFKKGQKTWNKGKKTGIKPWLGKKMSKKAKIKMSEAHKGEKNWNWKGGISPLNDRLRATSKFRIWRELVFLRDNFICQNLNCKYCNNKIGVMLHSHHIKSVVLYPELAFRVDNGITYCAEFHLKGKLHTEIYQKLALHTK